MINQKDANAKLVISPIQVKSYSDLLKELNKEKERVRVLRHLLWEQQRENILMRSELQK